MRSGISRPDVDHDVKTLTVGKNSDVTLDSDDAGHLRVNGNPVSGYASVASAATLGVPTARVQTVTGTTNVTNMTAGGAGQRVTLIFAGILTFTDGNNLKLAGNFVTTADDTITLVCDGTSWFETSRSVN
jgi:hypothetical protein